VDLVGGDAAQQDLAYLPAVDLGGVPTLAKVVDAVSLVVKQPVDGGVAIPRANFLNSSNTPASRMARWPLGG
jgi:hypothetical protein